MRVAFVVSDLTYPPREGLHEQSIITARMVSNLGFDVHLFGFVKDPSALDLGAMARETGLEFRDAPLATRLPNLLLGIRNVLPKILLRGGIRELSTKLEEYDVLHLENAGACGLIRREFSERTILGLIDPGSLRWARMSKHAVGVTKRISASFQRLLHKILEWRCILPGSTVHVVSADDADYLRRTFPLANVEDIPVSLPSFNVVDAVGANPSDHEIVIFMDLRQPHLRDSFLWLVRSVIPYIVPARGTTLRFTVLGRIEPDNILADAVRDLPVKFVSWVEDLSGALQRATVVLVGDRVGTGLKNRVVHAMALGAPTVGTSIAFEGIPVRDGIDAIVEDDSSRMAQRVSDLLGDVEIRATMATMAMTFARQRYDQSGISLKWLEIYTRIANVTARD